MAKGFQTGPYEVMFFLALKDGPAYGYELATRFRKMTRGHIRFSFGTIYPFLRRMERRGIIKSTRKERLGRVYYALTPKGRTAQERVFKQMKKSQKEWEEKLLGILAMHAEVFGRRSLHDLLERGKLLAKPS
ncbi:MAG: PadR family transcriptional regulator [Candidatus Bathyarchaeia archaeon]|jgi:DNA-binding PadR family transcriptional regulator